MSSRSNRARNSVSENESDDSDDGPLGERSIEDSDSEPSENSDSDRRRGKRNRFVSLVSDESSPKRRRRLGRIRKPAVDLITALPDSLLLHVLSFLPTEDVIKTQVLSRRWQYLWTYVTSLGFCFGGGYLNDKCDQDFVTFVDKTLFLCNCSKLKQLRVQFPYWSCFASNVNQWTRFAAAKGVEDLQLDFEGAPDRYLLPQLLYTNSSFKTLHFDTCDVMPKGVACWNSLKKLSIGYVKLSDDVIEKILAGSPVLEVLELYYFYGLNRLNVRSASVKELILREVWEHQEEEVEEENIIDGDFSLLEISGPHLHYLQISGDLCDKICRLGDVSSLGDAYLNFHMNQYSNHTGYANMLGGLLQSLVHVKKISLGTLAIQVLSIMEAKGLRSPLLNCESLTLHSKIWKSVLPGIANMLESSPNLKTLVIIASSSTHRNYFRGQLPELHNFDEKSYWTSKEKPFKCLMLHLQEVKFIGLGSYDFFHLCRNDFFILSFAQFLLKNARVLQKMVIRLDTVGCNWEKEFVQAARKLLSFPRSSPSAVVLF